jgi:putative addiction module CopG family antidote
VIQENLSMNLEIPADLNSFVQQLVASGSYRNENEVVIEGLRLLKSREQVRADVEAGIAELDAGLGLDGEDVLAELEEQARALASRRAL